MKYTLILAAALLLAGCNTIEGAGQDLQAGGHAIATTASKTKNAISGSSSGSSSNSDSSDANQ